VTLSTEIGRLSKPLAHETPRAHHARMSTTAELPAPNAPSGYLLPDLADLVLELGGSYPLLGYLLHPDEELDERTALDPIILAGLLHP
jgi:hypothetical protein